MEKNQITSDHDHDPLDDLLAQARWPGGDAESARQLARQWDRIRASNPRAAAWRMGLALAAMIMITVGLVMLMVRSIRPSKPELVKAPVVTETKPPAPIVLPPNLQLASIGREPTQLEWLLIHAAERRERDGTSVRPAPRVMAAAQVDPARRHEQLAEIIRANVGRVDPRAVAEFCAKAMADDLTLILRLSRSRPVRDETVGALCRLAGGDQLAAIARQDWPSAQRRRLLAALLEKGTPQATQSFLEIMTESSMKAEALAAVDDVAHPPVDRLLQIIQGPRADLGAEAALVLGRIDGPVTTQKLINLIARGQNQREAFLALASSRGAEARAFMRQATASDRYAANARSAMAQTKYQ